MKEMMSSRGGIPSPSAPKSYTQGVKTERNISHKEEYLLPDVQRIFSARLLFIIYERLNPAENARARPGEVSRAVK